MDEHESINGEMESTESIEPAGTEAPESTARFIIDERGLVVVRDEPGRGIPKQELRVELRVRSRKPYCAMTHFGGR